MTEYHPNPPEVPDQTLTPEEIKRLVEASELQTNTGWLNYLEQRPESKLSKEAKDLLVALRGDRDLPEDRDLPADLKPSPAAVPATEVAKPTEATKDLVQGNTKPSTPAGKYFNNLKGMVYLSSLLSQPGELFPAIELASAVQGKITEGDRDLGDDDGWSEDENIEDENVSESEDDSTEIDADLEIDSMENDSTGREDFDRVTLGPNSPDPPLDPQYKNALEQALRKLAQEIKEKSDCGMDVVRERADFAMIVKQLKSGTFCGRTKNDSDSTERPRQSVSKAIRTALRAIRKVSPADADHIEANLNLGAQIVYLDTSRKFSLVRAGEGWLLQ